MESLKTKAARAAEIALKFKQEKENEEDQSQITMSPSKKTSGFDSSSMMGTTVDQEKRVKELEKKVTKLRNEK